MRQSKKLEPGGLEAEAGFDSLDDELNRKPTSMTESYRLAASGSRAAKLPAYELQVPVATWLAGWLPQMTQWL